MGATAVLSRDKVAVDPGGEAGCEVRVRNTGTIVDEYTLEVLGDTAGWTLVEPPSLSLFPGDEAVANLRFRPPRDSSVATGEMPFGLRVASKEDPTGSAVEEGTVEVGPFTDTFAELIPRTSRGRRRARHDLAVDNRGNARVNATLSAVDPDGLLRFELSPPALVAEPGSASFATVSVRPVKRFLRGPTRTIPFQVSASAEGAPPLVAEGSMLQEALIPRWLPKALMGFAALLLLAGIAWLTLLRPTIKSAAKDAGEKAGKEAGAAAGQTAGAEAAQKALAASGGGGQPTTTVPGEPATTVPGTGTPGTAQGVRSGPAIDGRLVTGGRTSYQVPEGKTLQVTDIVLQNPASNTGTLQVQRSGTALLIVALDNFRDLDYHFVAPLLFKAGERLELNATCRTPNPPCTPGFYWAGFLVDAA
jgi:hypothetical protein